MAGFDLFDDERFANNHQSGIGLPDPHHLRDHPGDDALPGARRAGRSSAGRRSSSAREGNRFRTYSGFINDAWTLSKRWTFNLGLRYDKNDGVDSQGRAVVKDSALSPRFSATFDPKGDGAWTLNASYAHYVAAIANSDRRRRIGGRPGGDHRLHLPRPAGQHRQPGQPRPHRAALQTLFDWFNANGGTNRPTRGAPSSPA